MQRRLELVNPLPALPEDGALRTHLLGVHMRLGYALPRPLGRVVLAALAGGILNHGQFQGRYRGGFDEEVRFDALAGIGPTLVTDSSDGLAVPNAVRL